MERTIKFVLLAFLSISAAVFSAAAQDSSGDKDIDRSIQAFKAKHPDLYDMVNEEKLGQFLVSIRAQVEEEKKKPNFKAEDLPEHLHLTRPPIDIFKPEAIQELASHRKDIGIDTKNFDPTKFDRSKKNQLAAAASAADHSPQNIAGHAQAGSVTDWPDPDTIKPASYASASSVPAEIDERDAVRSDAEGRRRNLPDMPRCPKDTTLKYNFAAPSKQDTTVKDVLFIRAAVPSGADELFGKQVRVIQYTGKSDDPVSRAIADMHVLCLPFRMRLSQHISVQDFGLNALKNYDRDFNGSGELHPYVKHNQSDLLQ